MEAGLPHMDDAMKLGRWVVFRVLYYLTAACNVLILVGWAIVVDVTSARIAFPPIVFPGLWQPPANKNALLAMVQISGVFSLMTLIGVIEA